MTQEKKSRSWAFRCEAFKNSLSVSVVCRDCSLLLNTDPPRWWFEKVRFPCKALTISLKWRFLACFQQGTQLRGSASIQRRWSWLMGVGSGPGFYQHQTLKWGLGGSGLFHSQQGTLYQTAAAPGESLIRTNADFWQWKVYIENNVVIRKKNFLWSLLKSVEAKSSWGILAWILCIIFCAFVCGKVSWQARQSS